MNVSNKIAHSLKANAYIAIAIPNVRKIEKKILSLKKEKKT